MKDKFRIGKRQDCFQSDVLRAHRASPGKQHQIAPLEGFPNGANQLIFVIADDAPIAQFAAGFLDETGKRVLIDVAYLSGHWIRVGIDDLITRGDQPNAWPHINQEGKNSDTGECPQIVGPEPPSAPENQLAFFDVVADLDNVLPGRDTAMNFD